MVEKNMKKLGRALNVAAILGVASLSYSGSANAACCVVPMNIVASAISSSTTTLSAAIGAASTSIVGAIQYATQSPTSMLLQEIQAAGGKSQAATKLLMEAQASMMKAQSDAAHNQVQNIAADTMKVQAIENSRPVAGCSALNTVTAARVGKVAAGAAGGGAAASRKIADRLTTTVSPPAAAQDVVKNHKQNYCSAANAEAGRCAAPVATEYQNADISATAFMDGANADGKVAMTFNDKQKKAAEDFARNVVAPIPAQRLDAVTEKSPQGQSYVALHNAVSARKSVVARFFADHIGSRDPVKGEAKIAAAGAVKRAETAGYKPDGVLADGSYAQLLDLEANHRYMGSKWNENIQSENNQVVLTKHLVEMQAFQLHMMQLQMKQMHEVRALLAVAANELIEINSAPKLASQLDAAVRSTSARQ
jgi:hypothetical protein